MRFMYILFSSITLYRRGRACSLLPNIISHQTEGLEGLDVYQPGAKSDIVNIGEETDCLEPSLR